MTESERTATMLGDGEEVDGSETIDSCNIKIVVCSRENKDCTSTLTEQVHVVPFSVSRNSF